MKGREEILGENALRLVPRPEIILLRSSKVQTRTLLHITHAPAQAALSAGGNGQLLF